MPDAWFRLICSTAPNQEYVRAAKTRLWGAIGRNKLIPRSSWSVAATQQERPQHRASLRRPCVRWKHRGHRGSSDACRLGTRPAIARHARNDQERKLMKLRRRQASRAKSGVWGSPHPSFCRHSTRASRVPKQKGTRPAPRGRRRKGVNMRRCATRTPCLVDPKCNEGSNRFLWG